jgi:hypothetical protein
MDWINFSTFAYQAFYLVKVRPEMGIVIQQVSSAIVGIHCALLVIVFQRLKDLTFAGQSIKKNQVHSPVQLQSILESKGVSTKA